MTATGGAGQDDRYLLGDSSAEVEHLVRQAEVYRIRSAGPDEIQPVPARSLQPPPTAPRFATSAPCTILRPRQR
jgi:hypothetical protein